MKKYEYAFFTYDDMHLCEAHDNCNEWGKEGWELVSHSVCCDSGITVDVIFTTTFILSEK